MGMTEETTAMDSLMSFLSLRIMPAPFREFPASLSIKSELVKGIVQREHTNFVGAGIVIIESSGFVWVYDFSQDGKSLF